MESNKFEYSNDRRPELSATNGNEAKIIHSRASSFVVENCVNPHPKTKSCCMSFPPAMAVLLI
jgi:hypothetical protein